MATRTARPERGGATRDLILATAERLFAERGMHAVSNRQIGEAAGQANTAAVGYHFGTKADLVRAITRKHTEAVEHARIHMVADISGSAELRDWVGCLVRPVTAHLDALGSPTWYARFLAQVISDPALHEVTVEESLASPSLRLVLDGLNRCLPDLPDGVRTQRWSMARHLIVQMCVDHERALAAGQPTKSSDWGSLATALIDVIVALWHAPVTRVP